MTNESHLFEQFQGADLERLADCLIAIRKAGLQTSKHTQAGLNMTSGNVWVWDEDWAGSVACSIGFDVQWWWSCPNCGDEQSFDSYSELEAYVTLQNQETDHEGCTQCIHYVKCSAA